MCRIIKRIKMYIYIITTPNGTTTLESIGNTSCYHLFFIEVPGLFSGAYNWRVCIRGTYQFHTIWLHQYFLVAEVFLSHSSCITMHFKGLNSLLTYILIVLIVDIWVLFFISFLLYKWLQRTLVLVAETYLVPL